MVQAVTSATIDLQQVVSRLADLYVAVTRAEHSVTFVLDSPGASALEVWTPGP